MKNEDEQMKKNDLIKQTIINKTNELIRKQSNVTIKEIAKECYVNIAAVNYHFGSKDQLIEIVLNSVIAELKNSVLDLINNLKEDATPEEILTNLLEFVYSFALDNMGIVKYFFLQTENQQDASNLLLDSFFSDNSFTQLIFEKLSLATNITDPVALRARYMILFSAFAIPLFIQISQSKQDAQTVSKPLLTNIMFRNQYIKELIRLIN